MKAEFSFKVKVVTDIEAGWDCVLAVYHESTSDKDIYEIYEGREIAIHPIEVS